MGQRHTSAVKPTMASSPSELKAAIAEQNAKIMELFAMGDTNIASISQLYTEDLEITPHGKDTKIGRQSMVEIIKGFKAIGLARLIITIDEVGGVDGDTVYEYSRFNLVKEDDSIIGGGRFLAIWKKVDGVYKKSREVATRKP